MSSLYLMFNITDKQTLSMLNLNQTIAKSYINGNYVDNQTFHITLDFINNNENDSNLVKQAMNKFKDLYHEEFKQFYVFAEGLYNFNNNVLWMGVHQSFKLYKIKYILEQLIDETGYQRAPDKFDGYTPHITFAYDIDDYQYLKLSRIPILIDNITLMNSPEVNDTYVTNILHYIEL